MRATLLGAVGVDVLVGHDPKQPGAQVGALFEACVAAVRTQVGLLHQVFGVGTSCGSCAAPRCTAVGRTASPLSGTRPDLPRGDPSRRVLISKPRALRGSP